MKYCNTEAFLKLKPQYPEAILWLFSGDVYLCFEKDAMATAQILNLHIHPVNDQNGNPVHLAVFPEHAVDTYLHKMVKAGYSVGICQQLESAPNKGIQSTLF